VASRDEQVGVRLAASERGAVDGHLRLWVRGPAEVRRSFAAELEPDAHVVAHDDHVEVSAPAALLRRAGRATSPALATRIDERLAAWRHPPPDLVTPAGVLPTASRPVVMGILNVTPDSFSDGGLVYDEVAHPAPAVAAAERLVAAGADLIDVGGESTRPGAQAVDEETELARVIPVVRALAAAGIVVSIDTTKAGVARAAVDAGGAIVNDVSAGALDPGLLDVVAALEVPYVLMHMQGTPRTMQDDPHYLDVVGEVHHALETGMDRLVDRGIAPQRVVLDPGIGFGKRLEHNLELLGSLDSFTALGRPLLVGASRKSFLGTLTGTDDPADRLEGSLAVAALAVRSGARLLRVHDVAETVRTVAVAHAISSA